MAAKPKSDTMDKLTETTLDPTKAAEALQQYKTQQISKCQNEINQTLDKHNCRLVFEEIYHNGQAVGTRFVVLYKE